MRSISLETPEYATFHLGPSVEYRSSKALGLMAPTKMTDVVLKARPLVPSGPFRLRADYHNKNNQSESVYYSSINYTGVTQQLAILKPEFDDFICTYIKFWVEDTRNGETVAFIISAETFDDEKEKQLFALRARERDEAIPDYKDVI